jgi:hypothetical protein
LTFSDEERVAAKVEELDRLISDLQERKRELLAEKKGEMPTPPAPKKEPVESGTLLTTKRAPPSRATDSSPTRSNHALEATLNALPWKSFKKREGEWAFLRDREGRLIDELQSEKEFVESVRKKGEVVVGKYRYQVSEDRFLNRYFAGG